MFVLLSFVCLIMYIITIYTYILYIYIHFLLTQMKIHVYEILKGLPLTNLLVHLLFVTKIIIIIQ